MTVRDSSAKMIDRSRVCVVKFGGSSVASPERLQQVAQLVARLWKHWGALVVVVSAMGDTTDELVDLATQVSPRVAEGQHRREMDMLLTAGERISMSLLSMALADLGLPAKSFTGSQSGIVTTSTHGEARILEIKAQRIEDCIQSGAIAIVAGFQGVSRDREITTLGRGGSDTTAVALGVALQAAEVVIFTDVDGVYSADPRRVPGARRMDRLPWRTAVQSAERGAQVLHPRSVELAAKHLVKLRVASTFEALKRPAGELGGTLVETEVQSGALEGSSVLMVSSQRGLCELEVRGGLRAGVEFERKLKNNGPVVLDAEIGSPVSRFLVQTGSALQHVDTAQVKVISDRARVSILGTGLLAGSTALELAEKKLEEVGLFIVRVQASATAIDFLVEDSPNIDRVQAELQKLLIA